MAFADLTDVRCYFEVHGDGEPLLLVSGLGATCEVWGPIVPDLSHRFSLIAADNRGIGRSEAKRAPRTLPDLTADLIELLDYLQLDRAHVLGLSLGGIIAQQLAIDHPDRIDRLVLVSCTHRFTPYLRGMVGLLGRTLRRMPWETFVRTLEILGTSPEYIDAHPDAMERQVSARCNSGPSRAAVAAQLRCLCDAELEVSRIAAPTLVIASEYDVLIPNCYGRQMAAAIPNSEFALISGAGHNPLVECPRRVLPLITKFLGGGRGVEHGLRHDVRERATVEHAVTS